jgi:hypothetical protein
MVKRTSRENAKNRSASEDLSDGSGGHPHKKKRYNLRKRTRSGSGSPPSEKDKKKLRKEDKEEILWIDDDTLHESDSDDSSDASEDADPLPRVNIHIHTTLPSDTSKTKDWGGEGSKSEDDFLHYLIDKFGTNGPAEESESEESEEDEFYAETKWDNIENLRKKDTVTQFSVQAFLEWNQRFLVEVNRLDQEKKKKERNRDRPTGKEIFMNKANLLFIEDGGNGDDEETEGFDFKDVIIQNVDVDADVFADENDDMLDDILEEDN